MDKFLDLVKKRQSVRGYLSQEVEQEKLDYIFECVRLAPSACNLQPWRFLIIKGKEACKDLQKCYAREWFNEAPMYIIACADHTVAWHRKSDNKDHSDVDISIAIEHLCLAAVEQGLGTCWVCNFDTDLCKKLFYIPEHIEPIALIPIGYPSDETVKYKQRKDIEELRQEI
jgi:nitroreductase